MKLSETGVGGLFSEDGQCKKHQAQDWSGTSNVWQN